MAKCKNLVILIGFVGKDPEVTYTQSGTARAKFSLATSERWKDKTSDEWIDKTTWHDIIAWGKSAEYCGEYVRKGHFLYVEGKISKREWEKDDGTKVYFTEIVASGDIITLRSKDGAPAGSGYQVGGSKPPAGLQGRVIPPADDDDIPF